MNIQINAATTFPVRAKCRFCMKGPEHYLVYRSPVKWYNPKRIKEWFDVAVKSYRRMNTDFYLIEKPSVFTGIAAFSAYFEFKTYSPALHAKRGISATDDMMEGLSCGCGRTVWGFYQKSAQQRRDIHQRKSRYSYPIKFQDWF